MEKKEQIKILKTVDKSMMDSIGNRKLKFDFFLVFLAILTMFSAIYAFNHFYPYIHEVYNQRLNTFFGRALSYIILTTLVFQIVFLIYIVYLYLKYKPISSVSDEELPTCTIIVPAYNEGKLVYSTLLSIAASNYPKDKLEIWAIDDGSKDNTWYWINKANKELNHNLKIHQQPRNLGKRQALYKGFKEGNGEVFITIDSDSIVESDTVRNLVSPFVVDENCGAVAGNVKVLNKKQAIIPKMLNVSFVFSFEFIRAAQSMLGFVLCTPGALSAYRKEAVMNVLDRWINQKFAGEIATIGEDRAMTNMILEQSYNVLFQKNANVLTNTPTRFENLHKMFTRWARSNVRETLMMNRFIFKNFRKNNKAGARFIYFNQWMKILMAIPLTLLMLYFILTYPTFYIISALTGTFVFSSIQMLFFSKQYNFVESLWAYPYSIFYLFGLFWIAPFAILTVKNGGWLTRQ